MEKLIICLIGLISADLLSAQSVDMNKFFISNYEEKILNDPSVDFKKFKTYSIISANVLLKSASLTLEEKQIEFFFINLVATIGNLKYLLITDSIKPDLLFIYDFSNDYREKYIPPQTYSLPKWSAGRTITINSNATSSGNIYGDVNVYGNTYDTKNTTITESGRWETDYVERPAYTVGQFFPNFSLTIYNTSNDNKIWEGNANGISTQKDFRLAAQRLIWDIVKKLPQGSYNDTVFLNNNDGVLGIAFTLFNSDGSHFFPVIVHIAEKSVAYKKGIKIFDVILSVNDESTANKSEVQINDMMRGNAGTKIDLVIDRKGRILKKTLIKAQRQQ